MHIYDLAEEFGLSVEEIKKWLKTKGFGSSEKLTVAAVEAFRSQHRSSTGALSFERLMLGSSKEAESKTKVKNKEPKKWINKPSHDEQPKEVNPLMLEAIKQIDQPGIRISAMAKGAVIPKPAPIQPVTPEIITPIEPIEKEPKINDLLSQRQNRWQNLRPNQSLNQSEMEYKKLDIQELKQQQIEQFYQKQYEKLLDQYHHIQADQKKKEQELHQSKKEIDALQKNLHQLQKGRPMPVQVVLPPSAEENHKQSLWNELASKGFDQWTAISVLQQILLHPIQGVMLLHQLKHQNPSQLFAQLLLCCEHDICREISVQFKLKNIQTQNNKYTLQAQDHLLFVPAHLCPICQGSDHRRYYHYLQQSLLQSNRSKKIIVVGGHDDPHHSIKQLNHELPGIEWVFISGSDSIDQTRTNQKVQNAAIVVIWPTDHLPHSLSQLFKNACQSQDIPIITMTPGQRSVVNIVQNIMQKLELTTH